MDKPAEKSVFLLELPLLFLRCAVFVNTDSYVLNLFSRMVWIIASISRDLSTFHLNDLMKNEMTFSVCVSGSCFLIIEYSSLIWSSLDCEKNSWYSFMVACWYLRVKMLFQFAERKSCSNVFLSGNSVDFILHIILKMFFFENLRNAIKNPLRSRGFFA